MGMLTAANFPQTRTGIEDASFEAILVEMLFGQRVESSWTSSLLYEEELKRILEILGRNLSG